MFAHKKILCCVIALLLTWCPASYAQNDIMQDSIKDITTVLVMGAGGAVLGLSTLSFTETPKNHLRNILVGGAIGIIVGVGYVAYKQASVGQEVIKGAELSGPDFSTFARNSWHEQSHSSLISIPEAETSLSYTFTF
jgi:hypothetical protein